MHDAYDVHACMTRDVVNVSDGCAAFDAFLEQLGTRMVLKGFTGFRGGLDVTCM